MSYHNTRDKAGRFSKKAKKEAEPKKEETKKPIEPVTILNALLLDDTASMSSKVEATVVGFNKVIEDTIQDSRTTGTINVGLVTLFGEPGYYRNLPFVSIDYGVYRPSRPSTALWQAVVEKIAKIDEHLLRMPKDTKVIFTIFTDGENNAAPEYHRLAQGFIKLKQEKGWVINFVGAGNREFVKKMSDSVGIFASNSLNYENTSTGTMSAFASLSAGNTRYRSAAASGVATKDGFFSKD